jgi:Predicted membrane protein (DUF2339)
MPQKVNSHKPFFTTTYHRTPPMSSGFCMVRQETLSGLPGFPSAHIPSVLTAAGTTVAYAMVYAAYALYGFLPPAVAFSCSAWWRC